MLKTQRYASNCENGSKLLSQSYIVSNIVPLTKLDKILISSLADIFMP